MIHEFFRGAAEVDAEGLAPSGRWMESPSPHYAAPRRQDGSDAQTSEPFSLYGSNNADSLAKRKSRMIQSVEK